MLVLIALYHKHEIVSHNIYQNANLLIQQLGYNFCGHLSENLLETP